MTTNQPPTPGDLFEVLEEAYIKMGQAFATLRHVAEGLQGKDLEPRLRQVAVDLEKALYGENYSAGLAEILTDLEVPGSAPDEEE